MISFAVIYRRLDDFLSRSSSLTTDLPRQTTQAVSGSLKTELADRVVADLATVDGLAKAIARVQSSVEAVDAKVATAATPVPLTVEGFTRNEARLGLIRLLVQAQALSLDRTPAERVEVTRRRSGELKDDKGIAALLASETATRGLSEIGDSDLRRRFEAALQPFGSPDLEARLQRFLDIHRLILDIARAETGPAAAAAEEQKTGAPS